MLYQFQHFGFPDYLHKEYGENFSFPIHLHQSFEFITIFSGEMEINVDNTLYTLNQGESLLIFPHQLHSLNSRKSKHMLCIFSPEIVMAYFSKTLKKIPVNNKFRASQYLIRSLNEISENCTNIKQKGILYSICAEFDEAAQYIERDTGNRNLLYKIFEFTESNFDKDCSLEHLSKNTGFSYPYLSRYFKNMVGISFNHYVNQYRLTKACYILNNSDCSMLQCALESGYSSLRSFNRNFKSIIGITPQQYRIKGQFNK